LDDAALWESAGGEMLSANSGLCLTLEDGTKNSTGEQPLLRIFVAAVGDFSVLTRSRDSKGGERYSGLPVRRNSVWPAETYRTFSV
jgi:hypothetical protein